MRKKLILWILCSIVLTACKTEEKHINDKVENIISVSSLNKNISKHFKQYSPELYKYNSLISCEKTTTNFEEAQVTKELELFDAVKNCKFNFKPTNDAFALCHNLLIHSPEKGHEFLKLLNKQTENHDVIKSLYTEFLFAGEFGEQLVLTNLDSSNSNWCKTWSHYLSTLAIYDSSISVIENILNHSKDEEVKQDLISAMMCISNNPKSIHIIERIVETTKNEKVQAKAIYALAELLGKDGISYLEAIKCLGDISKEEKIASIAWLRLKTSSENKFGIEVINDVGFIKRYGNIKSPAIVWSQKEGLLNIENAQKPKPLSKIKKDELLNALIASKGFGIEAIKAQLFLSIETSDIEKLLALRQACCYSPNKFTQERIKTIGIFIRHLKKIQLQL